MFLDWAEEGVDPRVQIELERLNSTTNRINKLEVDLDEARYQFRQLLKISTREVENCSKKLGSCINKVRPYYDARIKAKEALQQTQKAALHFEKAVSAHAAAKEMVYLAEEGLRADGRIFDQAWQEMLNHATMRVNESEISRSKCEIEHKRTFQDYQLAEIRVLELQKELKKAIAKSRPYFEMKIQYSQLLESQKIQIKNLEKLIAESKFTYACTLRNLERISDEIHKVREKKKKCMKMYETFNKFQSLDVTSNSGKDSWQNNCSQSCSKIKNDCYKRIKFELLKPQVKTDSGSLGRLNSFSSIDSSNTENEIFKFSASLKEKRSFSQTEIFRHSLSNLMAGDDSKAKSYLTDYLDLYIFDKNQLPANTHFSLFHSEENKSNEFLKNISDCCSFEVKFCPEKNTQLNDYQSEKTEAKTNLKAQEIVKSIFIKNSNDDSQKCSGNEKNEFENSFSNFQGNNSKENEETFISKHNNLKKLKETSRNLKSEHQRFDVLWRGPTSEKVKEIFSQSLIKLNMGSLAEKSFSETKQKEEKSSCRENKPNEKNFGCSNIVYLTNPDETNVFNRQNFKKEENFQYFFSRNKKKVPSNSSFQGIFKSKKEKLLSKNVPSPLEKTLVYLNTEEDSNSDSESLASSDLLTDEQLSSLILDRNLEEVYQDVILKHRY